MVIWYQGAPSLYLQPSLRRILSLHHLKNVQEQGLDWSREHRQWAGYLVLRSLQGPQLARIQWFLVHVQHLGPPLTALEFLKKMVSCLFRWCYVERGLWKSEGHLIFCQSTVRALVRSGSKPLLLQWVVVHFSGGSYLPSTKWRVMTALQRVQIKSICVTRGLILPDLTMVPRTATNLPGSCHETLNDYQADSATHLWGEKKTLPM